MTPSVSLQQTGPGLLDLDRAVDGARIGRRDQGGDASAMR